MTDTQETTTPEVKVYNPYSAHEYNHQRAWVRGQSDRNLTPPITNPYEGGTVESQAWSQGLANMGVKPDEFAPFVPDPTDGTFIYHVMLVPDGEGVREAQPHIAWGYDRSSDEREDKLTPRWASLPEVHRSIPMGWNWASIMARSVVRSAKMNGIIELPCPPYEYHADGNRLTITAGNFTKGGSKQEWTEVLEQMQSEVEDLPDGQYVGDDYVDVEMTVTYHTTVSVNVTSLLAGSGNMDDDTYIGTFDEFEDDIRDALDSYDWEYEVDEANLDYPDIQVDDFNTDGVTSW